MPSPLLEPDASIAVQTDSTYRTRRRLRSSANVFRSPALPTYFFTTKQAHCISFRSSPSCLISSPRKLSTMQSNLSLKMCSVSYGQETRWMMRFAYVRRLSTYSPLERPYTYIMSMRNDGIGKVRLRRISRSGRCETSSCTHQLTSIQT